MSTEPTCVWCDAEDLKFGLFGNVFLFVFEILPYLDRRRLNPRWLIRTELYGADPDGLTIPGVLEPVDTPIADGERMISLRDLRKRRSYVLGNDWPALHALWTRYFRAPQSTMDAVTALGDLGATLGIQYRGHDKQTVTWDSNPVSPEEFLAIVCDRLAARPDLTSVLITTDTPSFIDLAARRLTVPVRTLGAGRFHIEEKTGEERRLEADHAVSDCIALSRCAAVLCTSSALAGFAKIFNPGLEIHRCAASKLFQDSPYFPIAYIPVYRPVDPQAAAVVERAMEGDWTKDRRARRYRRNFTYERRSYFRLLLHRVRGRLGLLPVQRV